MLGNCWETTLAPSGLGRRGVGWLPSPPLDSRPVVRRWFAVQRDDRLLASHIRQPDEAVSQLILIGPPGGARGKREDLAELLLQSLSLRPLAGLTERDFFEANAVQPARAANM